MPASFTSTSSVTSITFTWKDQSTGNTGAAGYIVAHSTGDEDNPLPVNAPDHSATFTNIAPNHAVSIRVRSQNVRGVAVSSPTMTGYTLATAPSIHTTNVTNLAISLDGTLTDATSYKLWAYSKGVKISTVANGVPVTLPFTLTKGLKANTTYFIYLQALNAKGQGNNSVTIATVTFISAGNPAPPIGLRRLNAARVSASKNKKGALASSNIAMTIDRLPLETRVHIIGKGGVLIRELAVLNNQAVWDGTDAQGQRVKRGVYYALLELDTQRRLIKFVIH
jgi:hypothetical protein